MATKPASNPMLKYYIGITGVLLLGVGSYLLNQAVTKDSAADQQTMRDLVTINDSIQRYASQHNQLPLNLAVLDLDKQKAKQHLNSYTYQERGRAKDEGPLLYNLCATFRAKATSITPSPDYTNTYLSTDATHPAGYYCFKLSTWSLEPSPTSTPTPTPTPSPTPSRPPR